MIRQAQPSDAQAICDIYNYYVLHTVVTFEEEPVQVAEMVVRMQEVNEKYLWVVDEEDGKILGYAYAGAWKARAAYRHSVELSVYLDINHTGKGIGTKLYRHLLQELQHMDVHAVMGGVALPNNASVVLHEKFGFEKVAHFKETGYKLNQWVDVAYWEKIIRK